MSGRPYENLIGRRFGKLVVIDRVVDTTNGTKWLCQCDCGGQRISARGDLVRKTHPTVMCPQCKPPSRLTHGHTRRGKKSSEYYSWAGAIDRCHCRTDSRYNDYGGRGIRVCDSWRESFETFLADMGPRPTDYTLERINNDGNYEPANCRWADRVDQANNQRPPTVVCPKCHHRFAPQKHPTLFRRRVRRHYSNIKALREKIRELESQLQPSK